MLTTRKEIYNIKESIDSTEHKINLKKYPTLHFLVKYVF